jgi:hypothetical protein
MPLQSTTDPVGRDPNLARREAALPQEFFQRLRFQTAGRGELRLALGVMEDAVRSLERNHGARGFLRRLLCWEAEQWFQSRDREPLFSFESICSLLDLDADAIREALHRWRETKSQERERVPGKPRSRGRMIPLSIRDDPPSRMT